MTPSELNNLYSGLRRRIAIHVPTACAEVSLPLPAAFDGELAFYRLVNWAYGLIHEAARVPLPFLMNLPPLRSIGTLRKDVANLRTYVAHNLDLSEKRDLKTMAAVHLWFKDACGHGSPRETPHFVDACNTLCRRLAEALEGSLDACDLLDDPLDGPRLIGDLQARVDLKWAAYRFDPIVTACADRLGNPALDLLKLRADRLDAWRRTLAEADEKGRARALELRIEADLLSAIGDRLPISAREASERLALAGPAAVVAGLLFLRDAKRIGSLSVPEIIELAAASQITGGQPGAVDG